MASAGINLLPWRQARRRRQLRLLLVGAMGLSLFVSLVAAGVNAWLLGQSRALEARIAQVTQNQRSLQAPLAEARALQAQLAGFDARFHALSSLEAQSQEGVRLFELLARQLPKALRLTGLRKRDRDLEIQGLALSNEAVSILMRRLEASALLDSPQRLELAIQKDGSSGERHFRLALKLADPSLPASWSRELGLDALAGDPAASACATKAGAAESGRDQGGCDAY